MGEDGYKYAVDGEGNQFAMYEQEVIAGSKIVTPAQQERNRQFAEAQRAKAEKERMLTALRIRENPLGKFVFYYFSRNVGPILKPESLVRLALLATYVKRDGLLWSSKRTLMTKSEAKEKLNLSNATFHRFWKEAVEAGCLSENADGTLSVSSGLFFRGTTPRTEADAGWMKIFINQMRSLYYGTPVAQHHYLGMVLQMIPYVNVQYNVLCWNPLEENVEEIAPMSMAEFCKVMGKAESNADEYRKAYTRITFDMDGRRRRFCQIARSDDGRELIFVNPRVFFAGDNWERVEGLLLYFADKKHYARPIPQYPTPFGKGLQDLRQLENALEQGEKSVIWG